MRENNSEGQGTPAIELDQVIEGDQIGSRNYRFVKVGESVPIKPPGSDDSQYDSQNPPSKPLAVSERFRLLFIAHSNGFYVARTKEVMALAEDIKDKGSGLSIDELSILNLSIGRVSILALSSRDSLLAASVADQLHFFSISALLHKEQKPSFSVCLDDLSCIKDIKWARNAEKNYVVLSTIGKLYQGFGQGCPMNVMVNVDAVEWSPKGAFIAAARKNVLSIMSSEFTEKLSFSLCPASVLVDSIRWVRADSIVLGCFEVGDDSEQASYFIQVIMTQSLEITDASSKPVVLSFSDVFLDYRCNVVPSASGPNMFLSYLDHHELAFAANRKNLSQHVVLLGWSLDNKKNEVVTIELLNDAWCAHIEPQGNGDDNLILALCVDKVSQNDEINFTLGEEETDVSPCCILLCLTIDGKLSLFHFISAVVASGSPEVVGDSDGQESACPLVLPEHGLSEICSEVREQNVQHVSLRLESEESRMGEPYRIWVNDVGRGNNTPSASRENKKPQEQISFDNQEQKPPISFQTQKDNTEETFSVPKPNQDGSNQQSVSAEKPGPKSEDWPIKTCHLEGPGIKARDFCKTETQAFSEAKPHENSLSEKVSTDLSSQSFSKNLQASGSLEFREKNVQVRLQESFASGISSMPQIYEENLSTSPQLQWPNYEQKLSKQIFKVEVMAKKMDRLLEAIGGKDGFRDASTTSQEDSVVAFEEGLWMISERCRMWRGVLENRLREIQLLLDKTVQVMARKIYMKGMFQQATDNWYSDLWNCQKLSSELELKRQHIVEVDQDLTTQLVELERHFNTIEFNKFGKSRVVQTNRRAIKSSHGKSRQQSLYSLHSTMGAQLAAAEELSKCLWKQMAALSVERPAKKQNVKRELFETLGLTYDDASYNSPGNQKATDPTKQLVTTSWSVTAKEHSRRNQYTPVKSSEPETVRRHRDTLDKKWSSSEAPKTTVKRIILQEERENSSSSRSPGKVEKQHLKLRPPKESAASHSILSDSSATCTFQSKSQIAETQVKQSIEYSSTLSSQQTDDLADPAIQVSIKGSPAVWQQSASTASASLNGTRESRTLSGKFRSSLPLFKTSESSSAMSSGKFSSSKAKIETHQKVSQSHLIVSSSLTSASTLSFSIPKTAGLSSTTPFLTYGNTEALESGTRPFSVDRSKRDGDSTKEATFSNSSSPIGEIFKTPGSVSQLGLTNGTSGLNVEPTMPSTPVTELSSSLKSENQLNIGGMSNPALEMVPNAKLEQPWPSTSNSPAAIFSGMSNNGKNGSSAVTNEDEMEEEAPEGSLTTEMALGNLGGFGIGSTPNLNVVKPNPFGVEMLNKGATPLNSPFTMPPPSGELFRPASFNFQSPLSSQLYQPANNGAFSSGFSTVSTSHGSTASGFGQPAQFGSQQALGSVLGAFGQSRQLGASPPRSGIAPPSGFGGGFSSVASAGGGFASLATGGGLGGGFAAAAMIGGGGGGGFAAAATAGGGFAAAATGGTGFASGGFGAFSNQGGGGFSTLASSSGAGRPPSELFTQMRK